MVILIQISGNKTNIFQLITNKQTIQLDTKITLIVLSNEVVHTNFFNIIWVQHASMPLAHNTDFVSIMCDLPYTA